MTTPPSTPLFQWVVSNGLNNSSSYSQLIGLSRQPLWAGSANQLTPLEQPFYGVI